MQKTKAWIKSFRLRTLPLSLSGVIMGSFMALSKQVFDVPVFVLSLTTTLFLQILSNLANDYGDSKNGADNAGRIGPVRAVQSGIISTREMKRMILAFSILSLISGISLIVVSHIEVYSESFFVLFILGLAAIWAALSYTLGNKYGYSGWGDFSVFIFFGLFSVLGSFFLFAGSISFMAILPAIAIGAFSVAVLNLNNMRDISNDKASDKKTLVVKIGLERAKYYHISLFIIAFLCSIGYALLNHIHWAGYLYLIIFLPVFLHIKEILNIQDPAQFDSELKKVALTALLFSFIFGLGINL